MAESGISELASKYEDLLHKFTHLQSNYKKAAVSYEDKEKEVHSLRRSLKERDEELEILKKDLVPVVNEYEDIKSKFEIENRCRDEAEKYAIQLYNQNKEIKRQSQAVKRQSRMLLQKLPSSFNVVELEELFNDDKSDAVDGTESENLQQRSKLLQELENEIVELKSRIRQYNEERIVMDKDAKVWRLKYEQEHSAYEMVIEQLQLERQELVQLQKVSSVAVKQYEGLHDTLVRERSLKSEAEKLAAQCYQNTAAMKRQSAAILSSALPGQQLMNALNDIEKLTKELEAVKQAHEKEMETAKGSLDESSQTTIIEDLETKLSCSTEEINVLKSRCETIEKNMATIQEQKKKAEERLEEIMRPPPPPPPPPPPASRSFFDIFKKKKTVTAKGGQTETKNPNERDENFDKALAEMMKRIKKGQALRPAKVVDSTETSAINEVQNVLKKISLRERSISTSVLETSNNSSTYNFKALLKNRQDYARSNSQQSTDDDESGAELMKKLSARKNKLDGENSEAINKVEKNKTRNEPNSSNGGSVENDSTFYDDAGYSKVIKTPVKTPRKSVMRKKEQNRLTGISEEAEATQSPRSSPSDELDRLEPGLEPEGEYSTISDMEVKPVETNQTDTLDLGEYAAISEGPVESLYEAVS